MDNLLTIIRIANLLRNVAAAAPHDRDLADQLTEAARIEAEAALEAANDELNDMASFYLDPESVEAAVAADEYAMHAEAA